MTSEISTRALYDQAASQWSRNQQLLLSDFTARPRVIEAVGDVSGLHLWDLGCGEGYVGRQLAKGNPRRIDGFDLSEEMIASARTQAGDLAAACGGPLHYAAANLAEADQFPSGQCDGAIAVFLFNYLSIAAMERVLARCHQAIRAGGFLVFTVPHPALAFLRPAEPPFYLEPGEHTYLGSSDLQFEGRIWRRDGVSNPVRSIHKTFADYTGALGRSGWTQLPAVIELGVTEEHLEVDPAFFSPLKGCPLHLLFHLQR
ncbi:MAG: class I SAM-dependent DNA methyltransferase [Prochlorococcaceae cyanobacterium]|jgi:SAM-dependent methyltransferase